MVDHDRIATIKSALNAARTLQDVEMVSDKYRSDVERLHADVATRIYADGIINLKAYRIDRINNGWG